MTDLCHLQHQQRRYYITTPIGHFGTLHSAPATIAPEQHVVFFAATLYCCGPPLSVSRTHHPSCFVVRQQTRQMGSPTYATCIPTTVTPGPRRRRRHGNPPEPGDSTERCGLSWATRALMSPPRSLASRRGEGRQPCRQRQPLTTPTSTARPGVEGRTRPRLRRKQGHQLRRPCAGSTASPGP